MVTLPAPAQLVAVNSAGVTSDDVSDGAVCSDHSPLRLLRYALPTAYCAPLPVHLTHSNSLACVPNCYSIVYDNCLYGNTPTIASMTTARI